MKFPLYNLWMDNMFYAYLGAFAASLFMLAVSVRALLRPAAGPSEEPAAGEAFPAEPEEPVELIEELPAPAPEQAPEEAADKTLVVANAEELAAAAAEAAEVPAGDAGDKTLVVANIEELISGAQDEAAGPDLPVLPQIQPAEPPQELSAAPAPDEAPARPEELVRGIYSRISGMDARVRAIEEHLKTGGGRHFAAKFLEGVLEDFDALSGPKIKARIEYLLSDLKEARERGEKDQGL